ncbi:hypothetical protein KFE25_008256 [Diacronema lutheri]|uniref:Uncharacterized protein n=1 Tax=Diacronema lutheri TaxID=2081491 RepID=A0A8J5XR42_DIALT|nr:hypothetical protein KFE25_008256 [Diacronema lutheri]
MAGEHQALDEDGDFDEADALSSVFCGVLGAPTVGSKRKVREMPSHAYFYEARGRSARVRPPAPPAPVCEPGQNEDDGGEAAHEREIQMMVSLGLPAALVQGSAMTSDRDGSAYCVLAAAGGHAHRRVRRRPCAAPRALAAE